MIADFSRQSDVAVCAALILLLCLGFEAEDGVTTVGDVLDRMPPDIVAGGDEEETASRTGKYRALTRIARDNPRLREMVIDKQSKKMGYHTDGLNAAVYTGPVGKVVVFLGTGFGEWNDNGVALLGIPQTNTYYRYGKDGQIVGARIVEEQASTQQAQALDYFHRVTTELGWTQPDSVTVTGHSKGGNKSQFITLNSPLVNRCYSFSGQGFSPEAIAYFKERLGEQEFLRRTTKMYSISSHDDFVNVMGECVIPAEHKHYLEANEAQSTRDYHELYSIVGPEGDLRGSVARGELSLMAERLWRDTLVSPNRSAISMAVMTACEHYFGNGMPINGEFVSGKALFKGGRIAVGMLVRSIAGTLFRSGVNRLSEEDRARISSYYNENIKFRTDSIKSTMGGLIDRALNRIGRQRKPPEEAVKIAVQPLDIGSAEPYFRVEPAQLRDAARKLGEVKQQTRELVDRAGDILHTKSGHNLTEATDRMLGELSRLERCQQHLDQTAEDFLKADKDMALLAGWVL